MPSGVPISVWLRNGRFIENLDSVSLEKDGEIAIFKLDQNNNQTFLEKTDISTEYLTEKDLENIKRGIIIYSKKELNKTIEDFE